MRRPGGYAHWTNGDIGVPNIERDTFQCPHCGGHVIVEPFQNPTEMGGWCFNCARAICSKPQCQTCVPFEKLLDQTGR